jgi:hypothetical protein
MHVRRIEDDAVNGFARVRKFPAINARFEIRGEKFIGIFRDSPPKNPFTVGDVSDCATGLDIDRKYERKNLVVSADVRTENKIVSRFAVR